MATRKDMLTIAAFSGLAYTAGYLTPLGKAAASFAAKCISPTATPVPLPAEPKGGGLYDVVGTKVVPQALYSNATSIFGLVRNHSAFDHSFIVHTHVFQNGDLIDTADAYAFLDVVPAHDVSPFRIDAVNESWPVADKVLFAVELNDNGYVVPQVTGVSVNYVEASDGSAHVSGYIRNTGQSKVTFPKVVIAYFAATGTVLYADSAYAETDNSDNSVGPGEQVLFFLKVNTVPTGAVAHKVYFTAEQEAA